MKYIHLILTIVLLASGCRDPFEPEVIDQDLSILVVEGYIETRGEGSVIKLTRTDKIRGGNGFRTEVGANIKLESANGESWEMHESQPGSYSFSNHFDTNTTYKLVITLTNGRQYQSEPLRPISTPEIDELGYFRDDLGVEIYVSTKGNDQAQYFLWDFEEHWMFRSAFVSIFKYVPENNSIRLRTPEERNEYCFKENLFPRIILQNSARFDDNRILQRELVRIPNLSEKLTRRYSISVRQRAIDQQAFDFWEILRKNTDDIGGIFSPLPSLIKGNIRSVSDAEESVIGYVSMGNSASKRLYINNSEVFPWQFFIPEYNQCFILGDTIQPPNYYGAFAGENFIPVVQVRDQNEAIIGYQGAAVQCTDCTFRGTLTKPDFWEE